jgi:hypothetical protein
LRAPEEAMITGKLVDFGGVFNNGYEATDGFRPARQGRRPVGCDAMHRCTLLYSEPDWNAAPLERDLQTRDLLS